MSRRGWCIGAAGVLVGFALGVAATYSLVKAKPQATKTEVPRMPRAVATHLMFEGAAEKAMNLYISLFSGSEIKKIERYGPGEQGAEGTIKRADFTLGGHPLICIDSPVKHAFTFTPSMSLFVDCENEAELNEAFNKLSEAGKVLMPLNNYGFSKKFGWVSDRFGVSWQLNLP
jgi:predicted 3-demethylubiquinone-9 3-methyltransferase (glyoxalase superfamily)